MVYILIYSKDLMFTYVFLRMSFKTLSTKIVCENNRYLIPNIYKSLWFVEDHLPTPKPWLSPSGVNVR